MYEIEIAEGKQMKIQFTSFDLEPPNYGDCFDFVIIYDIDVDGLGDEILLPRTCGDKLPGILTSKSNKVHVYFESDIRVQKKGWRFVYSETQKWEKMIFKQKCTFERKFEIAIKSNLLVLMLIHIHLKALMSL